MLLQYRSYLFYLGLVLVSLLWPFAFDFRAEFLAANIVRFFSLPFLYFQQTDYLSLARNLITDFTLFFPLGFLFAHCQIRRAKITSPRNFFNVFLILFLTGLFLEFSQILVTNRVADISDVFIFLSFSFLGVKLQEVCRGK